MWRNDYDPLINSWMIKQGSSIWLRGQGMPVSSFEADCLQSTDEKARAGYYCSVVQKEVESYKTLVYN